MVYLMVYHLGIQLDKLLEMQMGNQTETPMETRLVSAMVTVMDDQMVM